MKTWIAAIVDEELLSQVYVNETNAEFVERVSSLCLDEIESKKNFTPQGFGADVIEEIECQVVEVFRVRTYGYYNLQDYRTSLLKKRIG